MTNYFKAKSRNAEQTFAFDGSRRCAALMAFERATTFAAQHAARLSVCYPVTVAGPWSKTPVIVPEMVMPMRRDGLALDGEGGTY